MNGFPLWLGREPLILASKSRTRAEMLEAAGVPIEIVPAQVDERALEEPLMARGEAPAAIAAFLAREKALDVSRRSPGRLVLGADQVLGLDAERFTKPADLAAARAQLKRLSGRRHALHSAATLAQDGAILAEPITLAQLDVRPLSEDFLDRYLEAAGDRVKTSVGGYQLEHLGVQLFDAIAGDHFTVLGLPLLPLLADLRRMGLLAS